MKMFRTVNMDVINEFRLYFDIMLPSEFLVKRKSNFLRKLNSYVVLVLSAILALGNVWNVCDSYLLLLVKLIKFFHLSFYILLAIGYGE